MSKSEKQFYLKYEILDKGFDHNSFIEYLEDQKEDGSDIDNWTIKELMRVVEQFKLDPPKKKKSKKSKTKKKSKKKKKKKRYYSDSESEEDFLGRGESENLKTEKESIIALEQKSLKKLETQKKVNDLNLEEEEETKNTNTAEVEEQLRDNKDDDEEEDDEHHEDESEDKNFNSQKSFPVKKMEDTELSLQKDIKVDVTKPTFQKSFNPLKQGHIDYSIITQPFGWEVIRRYSDFDWLYNQLKTTFPCYYVT